MITAPVPSVAPAPVATLPPRGLPQKRALFNGQMCAFFDGR